MSATTAASARFGTAGLRASVTATMWTDLAVLTVLSLIAIAGFEPAFGPYNYLLAAFGGFVVGTVVALGCFLFRLSILPTIGIAILAYLLLGSPLTMPAQTLFGVIPSGQSLLGLFQGAIFGWADIVTLQTPVEAPAYIAVVPYFATWLVTLICVSLSLRWLPRKKRTPPRASILLIAPALLFLAGILLGTEEPYFAGLRGVGFAAIALVWLGWRRREPGVVAITVEGAMKRRRLVGVAIVVLGAIAIGGVGGVLLAPAAASRFVLRQEVTPPFDPLQYPSPLAGYRTFTKTLEKTDLFTVTGLETGQKIRMATLDSYDGQVWSVASPETQTNGSGGFELLGRNIPEPSLFTAGSRSNLTFTISGYKDVWLPNAEYPSTLDFEKHDGTDPTTTVRINTTTGTSAVTSGVSRGLVYKVGVVSPSIPNDKKLAKVPASSILMPPVTNVPDVVAAKAEEYAGSAKTTIQQLRNLERSLKTVGYLSHGLASDPVPSRAGEGADRMSELFTKEPMVGDEEQYASAFALMANHLGYPTRVVMGFAPKVGSGQNSVTVTGKDITAWDEVAFTGVGWVPFYPTPTKTDAPKEQTTKPKIEPQPQVRQPPRTDQKQEDLLTPVKISDKNPQDKNAGFQIPAWAWVVAGIIGIPLLAYFVPFLIIAALKRKRRRQRFDTGPPDRRVAGSWDELTDSYAELGLELPRRATRTQTAEVLGTQARAQGLVVPETGFAPLAARVDSVVFGDSEPSEEVVGSIWELTDSTTSASLESAGWLRRRIASFRYRRTNDRKTGRQRRGWSRFRPTSAQPAAEL
ncbi:transglutaminase domain-containing protein [Glaciihabitans sp. UYNi722]|uniref:transglutaminase family protein n=1 Tax=Glaciihabitans sp. UYNi722 TaxID=3156344 RepID=UPI003396A7CE